MKTSLISAVALSLTCAAASASAAEISAAIPESGETIGVKHNVVGHIGSFAFDAPTALGAITGLAFTLTLNDGDSAPGGFDYGDLTLGLDGIDTGLLLDGFAGGSTVTQTLTLSGLSSSLSASLYAALQDGSFLAEILDADGDPGSAKAAADPYANQKNVMTLPGTYNASLTLIGPAAISAASPAAIPEPTSLALAGFGLAGLRLSRRRRAA